MAILENSYRSQRPWREWDKELNNQRGWLLVGALTRVGLQPIPGIIGLFALLYYAIRVTEPIARVIFRRRDELKQKHTQGDEEIIEHDKFIGQRNERSLNETLRHFKSATLFGVLYSVTKWSGY